MDFNSTIRQLRLQATSGQIPVHTQYEGVNGTSYIMGGGSAAALAPYPHMRKANGFLFVSGTSSRRADNTHVGATRRPDGTWDLCIEQQTVAVLKNIENILRTAGAGLEHCVQFSVFLVDMKDFVGYNKAYKTILTDAKAGPTRTTVAVKQLPHPNLLIEIQAIAVDPSFSLK